MWKCSEPVEVDKSEKENTEMFIEAWCGAAALCALRKQEVAGGKVGEANGWKSEIVHASLLENWIVTQEKRIGRGI